MGSNSSPLIADLTLSVMEFNYVKKSIKNGDNKQFYAGRYFDDIGVINKEKFHAESKQIYGEDLVLKLTNKNMDASPFLDLVITIGNEVTFGMYNKTEDFNFNVIRYGYADSDVHTNTGLSTFYSQLIRTARVCDGRKEFEKRVLDMFQTFLTHGYNREALISKFFHFAQRCGGLLFKYDVCYRKDIIALVNRVFNR